MMRSPGMASSTAGSPRWPILSGTSGARKRPSSPVSAAAGMPVTKLVTMPAS